MLWNHTTVSGLRPEDMICLSVCLPVCLPACLPVCHSEGMQNISQKNTTKDQDESIRLTAQLPLNLKLATHLNMWFTVVSIVTRKLCPFHSFTCCFHCEKNGPCLYPGGIGKVPASFKASRVLSSFVNHWWLLVGMLTPESIEPEKTRLLHERGEMSWPMWYALLQAIICLW